MIDLAHRLEFVDPASLGPNPLNFRVHGPEQRAAFEGLLAEVGWLAPVIFNATTGRTIDGHMRVEHARSLRLPAIPVFVVDLDPAQEAKALASFDTLGLMATIDPRAWDAVLREVDTGCSELMGLFADLSEDWGTIPKDTQRDGGDGESDEDFAEAPDDDEAGGGEDGPPPADATAPDVVFASDNEWGIPSLDPSMQGDAPQFPVTTWGSVGRKRPMPGTWSFYTDDDRFNQIWADPGAILASGPAYAIEPNYSTHAQFPRAFVLWGVYRKRWVNRWWQTRGVRTFVDLNVDPEFQPLNLLGVPRSWRAFATRSHSGGKFIESEFAVAAEHAGTDRLAFVVHGGGSFVKQLCVDRGWFWVPEQSDVARGKVKS